MQNMDNTAVWPASQPYLRPVLATGFLTVIPCLAVFAVLRAPTSWERLRSMSLVKVFVLATMVDSFIFVWASAIILFGVGSSFSHAACETSIIWCIAFYASSKVFIYLFLMERVHLVHSFTTVGRLSRLKSPWYRASAVFFLCWIGVAVTMAVGRIAKIREADNACIIGLKLYATVPMLVVDAAVNIFLTLAFVIPIAQSKFHKARRLARNSCIAAVAALVTSFANIVVLSVQDGHQLGFVCLGSCGLDVAVNSAIIFIITRGDRDGGETSDITSAARDTKRRGSAYPPNGVSSMPAGTFLAGQNSAIGINPFTPGAPFVPSGLAGVSVSSEIIETEERSQHDDSYVPLRQGWRGSGSGRGSQSGNLLGLPGSTTPFNLVDETPVHCLAFVAGDVSADDEEKKSAEERV